MRKPWLLACCLLCIFGCAHLPWGTHREDPRTKGEEGKDPLGYPQDQIIVTQTQPNEKAGSIQSSGEDQTLGPPQTQKPSAPLVQKIYRVQFFATKYPDEASQVAETVANMVSEKTYTDYKTPYYWVRAGDCQTREEAERLLERIKQLGYRESWVVEVEVEVGPGD